MSDARRSTVPNLKNKINEMSMLKLTTKVSPAGKADRAQVRLLSTTQEQLEFDQLSRPQHEALVDSRPDSPQDLSPKIIREMVWRASVPTKFGLGSPVRDEDVPYGSPAQTWNHPTKRVHEGHDGLAENLRPKVKFGERPDWAIGWDCSPKPPVLADFQDREMLDASSEHKSPKTDRLEAQTGSKGSLIFATLLPKTKLEESEKKEHLSPPSLSGVQVDDKPRLAHRAQSKMKDDPCDMAQVDGVTDASRAHHGDKPHLSCKTQQHSESMETSEFEADSSSGAQAIRKAVRPSKPFPDRSPRVSSSGSPLPPRPGTSHHSQSRDALLAKDSHPDRWTLLPPKQQPVKMDDEDRLAAPLRLGDCGSRWTQGSSTQHQPPRRLFRKNDEVDHAVLNASKAPLADRAILPRPPRSKGRSVLAKAPTKPIALDPAETYRDTSFRQQYILDFFRDRFIKEHKMDKTRFYSIHSEQWDVDFARTREQATVDTCQALADANFEVVQHSAFECSVDEHHWHLQCEY